MFLPRLLTLLVPLLAMLPAGNQAQDRALQDIARLTRQLGLGDYAQITAMANDESVPFTVRRLAVKLLGQKEEGEAAYHVNEKAAQLLELQHAGDLDALELVVADEATDPVTKGLASLLLGDLASTQAILDAHPGLSNTLLQQALSVFGDAVPAFRYFHLLQRPDVDPSTWPQRLLLALICNDSPIVLKLLLMHDRRYQPAIETGFQQIFLDQAIEHFASKKTKEVVSLVYRSLALGTLNDFPAFTTDPDYHDALLAKCLFPENLRRIAITNDNDSLLMTSMERNPPKPSDITHMIYDAYMSEKPTCFRHLVIAKSRAELIEAKFVLTNKGSQFLWQQFEDAFIRKYFTASVVDMILANPSKRHFFPELCDYCQHPFALSLLEADGQKDPAKRFKTIVALLSSHLPELAELPAMLTRFKCFGDQIDLEEGKEYVEEVIKQLEEIMDVPFIVEFLRGAVVNRFAAYQTLLEMNMPALAIHNIDKFLA